MDTFRPLPGVTVLSDPQEVPGIGRLPVQAFVLAAEEPVVVDTGVSLADRRFVQDLGSVLDPADVRWIWLSTCTCWTPASCSPWATGSCAFRPPLFHSPATTGFQDTSTGVVPSSGGPVATAAPAGCDDVRAVMPGDLRAGQLLGASVDSPRVHSVDRGAFDRSPAAMRDLDASAGLGSHLPPALGAVVGLLDTLRTAPDAAPFVDPDQRALEELLAGFEPGRPDGGPPLPP